MPNVSLVVSKYIGKYPWNALLAAFVLWKSLLLLLAFCSPGPGYDTSSSITLGPPGRTWAWHRIAEKLTRWDALYFIPLANRGYVFEQEWAFGWGFTRTIGALGRGLSSLSSSDRNVAPLYEVALAGIALAHLSHFATVFLLYQLTLSVFGSSKPIRKLAFTASVLHAISPAGLFLSAPYAEAPFAALQFLGLWLFVLGRKKRNVLSHSVLILASGFILASATTFRSNGLLTGLIFADQAVRSLLKLLTSSHSGQNAHHIVRVLSAGIAGLLVILGFMVPQRVAWLEFCTKASRRSWCDDRLPSIYRWVQQKYWGVGLFRYWTLSNAPLFALAIPMLTILVYSAIWAIRESPRASDATKENPSRNAESATGKAASDSDILRAMALPQMALAILAAVEYHVQIITRISSAYPIWYWWLGQLILDQGGEQRQNTETPVPGKAIVSWMVIYSLVQGGLFASFLPPA